MKKMFFLVIMLLNNDAYLNAMQENDLEMGIIEESEPLLQNYAESDKPFCKINNLRLKNTIFKSSWPTAIPEVLAKRALSDVFPDEIIAHIFSYIPARCGWLNHIIRGKGFEPINFKGEVTPFFTILQNIYEAHSNYLIQKSLNNVINNGDCLDFYSAQNKLILHEMVNFMNTKKYTVYHSIEHDAEGVKIMFPEWADREIVSTALLPQRWNKPHLQNIPELVSEDHKNVLKVYYENTQNTQSRLRVLHKDDNNISQIYNKLRTNFLEDCAQCVAAYPNDAYFYSPCNVMNCISPTLCTISGSAYGGSYYLNVSAEVQITLFVFSGIFLFSFCLGIMQFALNWQKIIADKRKVDSIQSSLKLLEKYRDKIALLNLEEAVD